MTPIDGVLEQGERLPGSENLLKLADEFAQRAKKVQSSRPFPPYDYIRLSLDRERRPILIQWNIEWKDGTSETYMTPVVTDRFQGENREFIADPNGFLFLTNRRLTPWSGTDSPGGFANQSEVEGYDILKGIVHARGESGGFSYEVPYQIINGRRGNGTVIAREYNYGQGEEAKKKEIDAAKLLADTLKSATKLVGGLPA